MKKSKAIIILLCALLVLLGVGYVDLYGVDAEGTASASDISLGLDLAGGVSITYQVVGDEEPDATDMADTIAKLQKRVENYSKEAIVYQEGTDRINIEIPGVTDANKILEELGRPGSLYFIAETDKDGNANYSMQAVTDAQGNASYAYALNKTIDELKADGSIMLEGTDVKTATAGSIKDQTMGNSTYAVDLVMTEEGTKKFEEATRNAYEKGETLGIYYDGSFVSVPSVKGVFSDGNAQISPMNSYEEAESLASTIRIGGLKLELEELHSKVVGAQLGVEAISTSLKAAVIGFIVVAVFMIAVYFLPGFASVIALGIYVALVVLLLNGFDMTLTLSGIAGIILSIGMAVDANVIIFERIKEEMAAGKTVKSAIDSGFKRAFTAILDSNITTLIACGVLFFLGTGTIVGFATTLGIGVIVSMFTALTITHFLLRRMVDFHIRNPKAYGLRERKEEKKHFPILKNFKIFSGISVVLIVTGLVALILLPFGKNLFNLSIDFAGGTEMEFNMHTAVTQDIQTEVSDLFKDATGVDASSVTSSGDGNEDVLIRSTSIDSEQRAAVIDKMLEKYSLADTDILNNNDVSASVGSDLQRSAFICSILAILLMLVYITFRFELTSGLAAICCLVHDLLVMLSVYVLLQIPLDSNFIAAALTILGYSINASIIVFDRVRENLRTARKEPFEVIGEKSIWQTMGRTINTTLTTLFTIGMVYILGVPSLKQFTLPLIVGILAGGWSSVMLSTGLWGFFRKKFRRRRKI